MKYIKLFLASSIDDFKNERKELGDYIRSLNDIYVGKGIYFKLFICEDAGNALAQERKQDEYNARIKDSEYFYILFGDKAGSYSIEEFNVALTQFRATGYPKIYTYFQQMPADKQPADSVLEFMKHLDQNLGHFYSMFQHIDSVKLNILLELIRNENLEENIGFSDGKVILDGQDVLSLENVPFYCFNETVQQLRKQKEVFDQTFYDLRLKNIEDPQNDDVFRSLMEVSKLREKNNEKLHELEADMFHHYDKILEMNRDGKIITERGKAARRLLDAGNYAGAIAILNDEERVKELEDARRMADNGLERLKGYLSENKIKIAALRCQGTDFEQIGQLEDCYRENGELAEEYHIEYDCIYEYAGFLYYLHHYSMALEVANRLEKLYEDLPSVEISDVIDVFLLKANIYAALNESKMNVCYLRKAKKLCKEINHRKKLIDINNNLGIHFAHSGACKIGASYLRKAMELSENKFDREYALMCGNLANCLLAVFKMEQEVDMQELLIQECKELYDLAIEIEEELNKDRSAKDLGRLSEVYYNMAFFCYEIGKFADALSLCKASLAISRQEAKENPYRGLISVVQRLKELAYYYDVDGDFERSEPLYQEAIEIIGRLHNQEPNAYEEVMAHLYGNYGYVLKKTGREKEGAFYLQMASNLYYRLLQRR